MGEHTLRSKTDRHGNRWEVAAPPNATNMTGEGRNLAVQVAEALGYDPFDPPQDCFMLACFPNSGAYEVACAEIEKAQKNYQSELRQAYQLQAAHGSAVARNAGEQAAKILIELTDANARVDALKAKFYRAKAVVEHAVQRYYLIPMEAFEKMDSYGVPISCTTAGVVPQKKYQNLPVPSTQDQTEAVQVP